MNPSPAPVRSSREVLTRLDRRVPDAVARRLDSDVAPEPVAARRAVSVILLRDGAAGRLQVYLLHRHGRMPFAAGAAVFPGGRVDDADVASVPGYTGADATGPDLGSPVLLRCGVRETAEETGVELATAALYPWAHWITPECEPRRYDTYFYLAALPAGQDAADLSGETSRAEWREPSDVLTADDRDELELMPPTRASLLELNAFGSVADALAGCAGRRVETVLPRPVREGGAWMFDYREPGDAGGRI